VQDVVVADGDDHHRCHHRHEPDSNHLVSSDLAADTPLLQRFIDRKESG
jgi:hypothetical protein